MEKVAMGPRDINKVHRLNDDKTKVLHWNNGRVICDFNDYQGFYLSDGDLLKRWYSRKACANVDAFLMYRDSVREWQEASK